MTQDELEQGVRLMMNALLAEARLALVEATDEHGMVTAAAAERIGRQFAARVEELLDRWEAAAPEWRVALRLELAPLRAMLERGLADRARGRGLH